MSDQDGFAIIDSHRSANLDDQGAAGWTLAVAIGADGSELLGVVKRADIGRPGNGFPMDTPRHEELGRLGLNTKRLIRLGQNITTPTGQELPE